MDFISKEEKVNLSMRRLYELYGYTKYRMNKFEEYSFYLQNKNFLEHDRYITFNDLDGRLMALKPDVTLSIVKNATHQGNQRIYYSESIFRTGKGSKEFAELKQTGLEYIGKIDICSTAEVLTLALKTLEILSDAYVLSISHMGVISAVLDQVKDYKLKRKITNCLKSKNRHELAQVCADSGLCKTVTDTLLALVGIKGSFDSGIAVLKNMDALKDLPAIKELCSLERVFANTQYYKHIQLDFSAVSSTEYYNGILLSGFVQGVATEVLTGGRYDNLLERMGKQGMQAMGFAVNFCYMEQLLRRQTNNKYCAVLYDDNTDAAYLCLVLDSLTQNGKMVQAVTRSQYDGKAQEVIDITQGRRAEI